MRLALPADYDRIEQIAHDTMVAAWPDFIPAGPGKYGGFAEQLTRPGVIVAVNPAVTAFILSERMDADHWMVRYLMPLTMGAATGKGLITFALRAEHKLRPLAATTETFARLQRGGANVESATRDAYRLLLGATSRKVADADGVVRADDIFLPAAAIAKKLGVILG